MKKTTDIPIRWGRSLLLGIFATIALFACYPVWELGQMGGPIPFTYLWLPVTSLFLLLALFLAKPQGVIAAVLCGLLFAIPVATCCWVWSVTDSLTSGYFGTEMRHDSIATLILSVILMLSVAFARRDIQARHN
jgi:hypothetical protein